MGALGWAGLGWALLGAGPGWPVALYLPGGWFSWPVATLPPAPVQGVSHRHVSDHLSELVEGVLSDLEASKVSPGPPGFLPVCIVPICPHHGQASQRLQHRRSGAARAEAQAATMSRERGAGLAPAPGFCLPRPL